MPGNRYQQTKYAGYRLNKNVYNRSGALVLSAFTLLTRKDVEMLNRQQIFLRDDDVESASVMNLVNAAIHEITLAFDKVKQSRRIPLETIHEKIVPLLHEMSRHSSLKSVLTHLQQHDEYTYRHSIGVAVLSRFIGSSTGLKEKALDELTVAGFLHDIGKMMVPEEIINKPGKLTGDEYRLVKNHTIYGFEIIKNTPGLSYRDALIALQHHEREDGSGYPYGLKGIDIDPYSKIIAVADVFHAMITKRAYKEPIPFYKALQHMWVHAWGTLEPEITLRFVKRVMEMLIGSRVLLSNGYEGKIVMVGDHAPIRPLVEVNGRYIDLSKDPSIQLERIV